MLERQSAKAPAPTADQASGLRRMFEASAPRWSLVLQPTTRSEGGARGLAVRAHELARALGNTLLIDAARTHIAAGMGLALRYDLDHVLQQDCTLAQACVGAADSLWVLPAARALDRALADPRNAEDVAKAMDAIGQKMRHVMLVLPAARAGWSLQLPGLQHAREALIPVVRGSDSGSAVLTAVRQAVSEAQIDTFHLLFLGMGQASAGRLLTGMAAIAQRHFGAKLLAVQPGALAEYAAPGGRSRHPVLESVS